MIKMSGNSLNIEKNNREYIKKILSQNMELKEIFPDLFIEGDINLERLQEELGTFKSENKEKYNFTWNGKINSKKISMTPSTATLLPLREKSKNYESTQNIYIEGDNLEVLKLLQKTYYKKIKMIYIDPPYNTGKDFVYKDNFKDNLNNYLMQTGQINNDGNKLSANSETSGRYHSDWLSMMYPRLRLARNLLKDDGIIFISIDDNEISNLTKICDEIFGEDNAFTPIIWSKGNAQNDAIGIQKNHEYILAYHKGKATVTEKKSKKLELYNDEYGFYTKGSAFTTGGEGGILNKRPNLGHSIYYNPHTKDIILKQDYNKELAETSNEESLVYASPDTTLLSQGYVAIRPPKKGHLLGCWTWSLEKFNSSKKNILIYKNTKGTYSLLKKNYIDINENKILEEKNKQYVEIEYDMPLNSIFDISSSTGTSVVNELIGNRVFQNPKPVSLIKKLLQSATSSEDIILDFFSGSGTTAHATMELNSISNEKRRFIMVQLPEETDNKKFATICDIGQERIRKSGEKIKADNPNKDLSTLDIGFKVFKLDSSNIKEWDSDFDNLEANLLDSVENIKEDRTNEDLLYEILLKYGLDLTLPIEEKVINDKTVYVIGFGALVVCLDYKISIDIVEEIAKLKEEYQSEIMRVVFKDSSFKDAVVKTNAIQVLKQFGIDEVVSI